MPDARSGDVRLHYESDGEGPPVLLIMGLGMNATGWWRTVPVLAERLRVISFDNRGVGRSDRPEGPYSIAQMAADALAVLDAASEKSAHVYGISLGGMIAQEVALTAPERVRSLVLGATTAGGDRAEPIAPATLAFMQKRGELTAEEAVWASVPYNYAPRTRREAAQRIAEDIERRLLHPIEAEPYKAQLAAATGHDAGDRLRSVDTPTLVIHGEEDALVPPGNGRVLADLIPDAQLELLPDAAHLYPTDEPAADRAVLDFLTR